MISTTRQRLKYVISDYVMTNIAWFLFSCTRFWLGFREGMMPGYKDISNFLTSANVVHGQLLFPFIMMLFYWLSGYYNEVFRKSRLQELLTTFSSATINTLVMLFVALINDLGGNRYYNYEVLFALWGLLFVCTFIPRSLITNASSKKIKNRTWSFKTLIVGCGHDAKQFGHRINTMKRAVGYNIVGYVKIEDEHVASNLDAPVYDFSELQRVCSDEHIEELIVVPTYRNTTTLLNTINQLFSLGLPIKLTPDMYSILLSNVRISDFYGDPLIDISGSSMSESSKNMKRLIDVVASAAMLVLLSPLFAALAIIIKCTSKGSVIYSQERIGLHNKPFQIYKFRSMVSDAESRHGTPQLSAEGDSRITPIGRIMRKYRLDELPQFWNVLCGDMSIVGPRPERQFYIDQIVKKAPSYMLVHQVRPGITSMGMVKYGYAKNVDEMIIRLKYDLLYLENMSLLNDFKILIYTVMTVVNGRGI